MKQNMLLLSAVILTLIATDCLADTPQNTSDTNALTQLQDYLQYAALNNAGLKAAFEQWKAAIEQVPQAKSLPDPRITYEIDTEVDTEMDDLAIMQEFPWFGTLEARGDAASAAAKAAHKKYEATKLKLFYEVKEAFYEYVYLASAIQITKENLELVKHFEEVAVAKYQVAAASSPDVIRSQTELANLEYVLKSLEEMRKPIVAKLNAALNRQTTAELPWPQKPKFSPVSLDRNQIVEILKRKNPQLAGLDFELEAAKSNVTLAEKRFYPDLGIGLQRQRGMSSMDDDDNRVLLMFSMSLPLWRQNYKASELQARAEEKRIRYEKADTEINLLAQAAQALYDFEDSTRRIRLYGDVLTPKAQELVMNSETAYKAGSIDFLSLIDAQRMLLEYRLMYERAIADNAQKLAELEMLVGTKLSDAVEEPPAE